MKLIKSNGGKHSYRLGYTDELKEIRDSIIEENYKIIAKNKKKEKKAVVKKKQQLPTTISGNFIRNVKKYKQRLRTKAKYAAYKEVRKFVYDLKKQSYKYKDMQHPDYKKFNFYRFSAFKKHILPRSEEGITVEMAWIRLWKCWTGFKISYGLGNTKGMKHYGRGIQKYAYLLEEIPPDMSNIGLKPYNPFISYEDK